MNLNSLHYSTTSILDYNVFIGNINNINLDCDNKIIINTINPHSYAVSKRDNLFRKALLNSDILLPDGIGIIYACKYINKIRIERITGYDLLIHSLKYLNKVNGKCYFLGSTKKTLELIKNRIIFEYPNISIAFYSPPFKNELDSFDNQIIINKINGFNPDIVFVGMTAPKQEKWVFQNCEFLDIKTICSIGAAFDYFAGIAKRPTAFWRIIGLEWLFRFFKNPIKMWRRIILSAPIFFIDVIKNKFNL